ncbi:EAL domain-containing protein [Acidovorax sp. HDW3]|uniref:GGDEF/EAL domain-containing response regulator n=1 Tax=Acidovorax sp. HDW3 TaxID=2714923 RepID=UPI00140B4F62|nr:EAL domain-containing protein [Acidovorax sp. HDW3]QIL43659.1 EAL domain-containing protein [Acidovorax sp. HDW3]
MAHPGDDVFTYANEEPAPLADGPAPASAPVWQVLIVDDEPDVHAATVLALKGLQVQGRALAFSHAESAAQARALLAQRPDFAVALIDVVMESDDAGLQLVRHIREELGNLALRIILRTGQPGYAPEIDTIARYDINDYKTKSELTQVRLFTSLTMALRSYAQIRQLQAGRRGLEKILAATAVLGQTMGLQAFASGLVTQLCALLDLPEDGLVCAAAQADGGARAPYVLAAAGQYGAWMGLALADVPDPRVRQVLQQTLARRAHGYECGAGLFFDGGRGLALAAYVDIARPLEALERGLLEVFCSNIAVAFENLQLYLQIKELAFHDALVGLPNRNALAAAIDLRSPEQDTVALLDLDNFADINSVLDPSYGDAVLQAVAQQLQACFAPSTVVARLGGDLFGLLGTAAQVTPECIAQAFAQPLALAEGEPLRLSVTAGLVQLNIDGVSGGAAVLKNASAALKQAKRFARGKALYFEAAQADAARERIQLLNRLRASFSEERLFLHYQPFIALRTGRVVGAECLLRWKNAQGQFVPPDRFIPLAEQSGLMVPIGEWVARTALAWRKSLGDAVAADFRVAINVSHVQFVEPDFVPRFLAILDEAGVPGPQVEVELTESVAIENVGQLAHKLEQLRARGIRVAMDDFGTGYSSLSIIQGLQLDRLKIDRSFVSGAQAEAGAFEIARTILTLARHLHLATIAEGIETTAQRDALRGAGCEEGQGYLFSPPLDAQAFRDWLAQQPRT